MGALWKLIPWQAWVAGAAMIAVFAVLATAEYRGYQRALVAVERKAVIEAAKRIKNMENNNEEFRNLSSVERCRAFLRDSGLHPDECDKR